MSVTDPRVANEKTSQSMLWLARAGLVARGVVYAVLGWLAIDIATGNGGQEANQKGALAAIADRSEGKVLLGVLAVGVAAYALWQLAKAIWGTPTSGKRASGRLRSACGAVAYGFLCATAVQVLVGGSGTGQSQQQEGLTARLMRHTGGRWLIGILGVIVLVVGLFLLVEGIRRTFLGELNTDRMGSRTERAITVLGVAGGIARGVVVGLAGALVIDAAASADPHKSTGLDGALRTLSQQSFGPWLLGLTATGLICFGAFSATSAPWVRD